MRLRPIQAALLSSAVGLAVLCAATSGVRAQGKAKGKSKTPRPTERVILKSERAYLAAFDAADCPLAVGAKIDIRLRNGTRSEDLELTDLEPGKVRGSLRTLGVKSPSGKRQKLRVNAIARILVDERPFDLLLDSESTDYVVLDVARRDQLVAERLAATGYKLWSASGDVDPSEFVEEYKRDYFDKVKGTFPNQTFELHETQYFLFFTNMPHGQVKTYIDKLDAMYQELGRMFGLVPGTNIWRGKCVVIAFTEKVDFQHAEVQVMRQPPGTTAQGLCHQPGDGRIVVTCYRGSDPAFFACLLVHETTHGFVHLYRSNGRIPSWLNEGLAEWVASTVVPESTAVARRQQLAIPRLQGSGRMEGMFDNPGNIEPWQYGVASSLADFLIQTNPQAYGGLFTLIKEGDTWQNALREQYGVSPQELAAAYGRTLGIAQLAP